MPKSSYTIQTAESTYCPTCEKMCDLLAPKNWYSRMQMFYICWNCKLVYQTGMGRVERES